MVQYESFNLVLACIIFQILLYLVLVDDGLLFWSYCQAQFQPRAWAL